MQIALISHILIAQHCWFQMLLETSLTIAFVVWNVWQWWNILINVKSQNMLKLCSTHGSHESFNPFHPMKLQSTQIAGMYPLFVVTLFNVKMNMFSFQCFETQPSTELISNNAGLRPTLGSVSHDRNVRVAQTFLAVVSRDSHPFLKRRFIMFHRFRIQSELDFIREVATTPIQHLRSQR